ncbi:gibberellin 2-beta-dioxygenase 2-like [Cornus florida]|uniref:gibberellin 2-beta-dioxygenase 2-like n=1 Tax=Cornus florida TaxID=4283 RepID=UPI0028A0CD93|nr:gibberellin 2-beta-dioxygenase 2-like [Cornus florida]
MKTNMVMASQTPIRAEKIRQIFEPPIIDLSNERAEVSKLIVKACEEYGFFKVMNHGVPEDVIRRMEEESFEFFAKPASEKQLAGPPFGYGSKNIGFNGDVGEVEYLLLYTNPPSISQKYITISNDPTKISFAVCGYIEAVRGLACEILDLMAEGLRVPDTSVFSRLIRDVDSDSILRLNHYPPLHLTADSCFKDNDTSPSYLHPLHHQNPPHHHQNTTTNNSTNKIGFGVVSEKKKIGFGEHSDPQILTILRSNDVGGLQISVEGGVWVPISPDPAAFCVNVGDVLQAMTNGRFVSVKHKVLSNISDKSRMSMVYFCGPPLNAKIAPLPELVTAATPSLYRPFTWAEFKEVINSLRLADSRFKLFKIQTEDEFDG